MKKTIILLSMLAGLTGAVQASAQQPAREPVTRPAPSGVNTWLDKVCSNQRAVTLRDTIKSAGTRGALTWGNADHLQDLVKQAEGSQKRYCDGHINSWKAKQIDQQFDTVEARVRTEIAKGRHG